MVKINSSQLFVVLLNYPAPSLSTVIMFILYRDQDEVSGKPPPTAVSQSSSASYIEALDNLTIGYSQLLLEEPTEVPPVIRKAL